MPRVAAFARAKVNLTLAVMGRRPDGYHEIESLVAFAADIGDRVAFEPGANLAVRATGPFAAAITGENLAGKALTLLRRAEPRLALGAVEIEKNIPVAAGLGGGSADAAAVLRAVRAANPGFAETVDWRGVARGLGADVPVCLESRAAIMAGAGERVSPWPDPPPLFAVLVNAHAPVPAGKTARVFSELKAGPLAAPSPCALPAKMAPGDFIAARGNDLEAAAAALMPEILAVLAAIRETPDCAVARLSGAGPTCFGLYPSLEHSADAARRISAARPAWWVAATALG